MFKFIKNPVLQEIAEWLFSLGIAVLLFFVVRAFLFRVAHVDGSSMTPTLEHGDRVILNRLAYYISSPGVGDIIAFPFAENPSEFYIKRIIAEEGDMVDFHDGSFFINGVRLDDDFSDEPVRLSGDIAFPITIQEGHFFVLGDNRNGSQDSRFANVGNIAADDMIGKATIRIWPLGRIGRVNQ